MHCTNCCFKSYPTNHANAISIAICACCRGVAYAGVALLGLGLLMMVIGSGCAFLLHRMRINIQRAGDPQAEAKAMVSSEMYM